MPTIVHYEVYSHDGRDWRLNARFTGSERESAVAEAKRIEKTLNIPVRVTREIYYPEGNQSEETVAYIGRLRAPAPRKRSSGLGGGIETRQEAAAPFSEGEIAAIYGSKTAREATTSDFAFRLALVLIVALVVAVSGAGISNLLLGQGGMSLPPSTHSLIMFLIFLSLFMVTAIPLVMTYVPLEALGVRRPRPGEVRSAESAKSATEAAADGMAATPKKKAEAEPPAEPESREASFEAAIPPDEEWPLPDVPEEDAKAKRKKQKEKEKEKREREDRERAEQEKKAQEEAEAAKAAAEATESVAFEGCRLTVMKFLGGVVNALKATHPQLDAYNKFGVNLFIAGACESLATSKALTADERTALVREAVEVIGTRPEQARHLVERLDGYRREPRYRSMIGAGRMAMELNLSGDSDPFIAIGGIMKDWNTPQSRQVGASTVTILFTDMIGSTDLTHQIGDAAAQDVIRAHNHIVRTALSHNRGKEVKHTGDGIMASFDDAVDAIGAAVDIQRKVAEHNERWPKLPLHLRIGMNTGEPIVEENDYFGATVQVAARVCAAAGTGQVWIGPTTRNMVPPSSTLEIFEHGPQVLKGVKDAQTLYEVVWNDERSSELDAIRRFRASTTASPPTSTSGRAAAATATQAKEGPPEAPGHDAVKTQPPSAPPSAATATTPASAPGS